MNIAGIAPYTYLPYHSGGQKLIAGFYHSLARLAHVHVITTDGNKADLAVNYVIAPLLGHGVGRYINPLHYFSIRRYIKKNKIEILVIEHPYLAWLGVLLKKTTNIKLVFHTHNIEYQRFRSIGKWWWRFLKIYEGFALKSADLVFAISEEDKTSAISSFHIQPSKISVVPYGTNKQEIPANKQNTKLMLCQQLGIPADTFLLLFSAPFNYQPNLDALEAIVKSINPYLLSHMGRPYQIIITGKHLPPAYRQLEDYRSQHIRYTGFVDNIDDYFLAADILLNPVLTGGGVKTKIIEALALDTTVVSTETGAIGVNSALTEEKLITARDNNWEAFAQAVIDAIGKQAHISTKFYQCYYWGNIARQVISTFNRFYA